LVGGLARENGKIHHGDTEGTENGGRTGESLADSSRRGGQESVVVVEEATQEIIGAAIEVYRTLGPGLLESAYETCLCVELPARGRSRSSARWSGR